MVAPKRVLIIDDDPDFADYVRIVLSANGYEVRTASTAQEGLEIMREAQPHLVIVDVMMSYVLDGWSVSHAMRCDPALSGIPVLMVSAIVTREDDALFPVETGRIDAFMSKPLEPPALLERVAELIHCEREGKGES